MVNTLEDLKPEHDYLFDHLNAINVHTARSHKRMVPHAHAYAIYLPDLQEIWINNSPPMPSGVGSSPPHDNLESSLSSRGGDEPTPHFKERMYSQYCMSRPPRISEFLAGPVLLHELGHLRNHLKFGINPDKVVEEELADRFAEDVIGL